jgi:hypothetical protein
MRAELQSSSVETINRFHNEAVILAATSRESLHAALAAAWQAGQLLLKEKKRVRHTMGAGAWLSWLEANFHGSPRTAQRYMLLARSVADMNCLRGLSLRRIGDRDRT